MSCSKPMNSDLQRTIHKEFLTCSVCHETYKQPKVLDCGHIFCLTCLQGVVNARKKSISGIPCPLCRRKTPLPRKGVSKLPDNFVVSGMTQLLQTHATNEKSSEKNQRSKPETSNSSIKPRKPTTNTTLVKNMVKAYETSHCTPTKEKGRSGSRVKGYDTDTSSSEDSECSTDSEESFDSDSSISSFEEEFCGESIASQDSYDSDLYGSENGDYSQLSFVTDGSDLNSNSSSSFDEDVGSSSDDLTSSDSSSSSSSSSSDSISSSSESSDDVYSWKQEYTPTRKDKKAAPKLQKIKKEKEKLKIRPASHTLTKSKENQPGTSKVKSKVQDDKEKAARSGKILHDTTNHEQSKMNKKDKAVSKDQKTKKCNPLPKPVKGAVKDPIKVKHCNGMKIGAEILLFVGEANPLQVSLKWMEKVEKSPGAGYYTFAGVELKSKKSNKLRFSREYRSIKNNPSSKKNWLDDEKEKKGVRAVVPIHQCAPKNLLKAVRPSLSPLPF